MNLKGLESYELPALLAELINNQDGLPRLKFIEVATTDDFYFEQTGNQISAEDILRTLIEIDGSGDYAIRIGRHTVTGSTKFNKSELSEIQLTRSVIGKTSDGKPYLRTTISSATSIELAIAVHCDDQESVFTITA